MHGRLEPSLPQDPGQIATIPSHVAVSATIMPSVARIAAGWMSSDRLAIAIERGALALRIVQTPFLITQGVQHTPGVRRNWELSVRKSTGPAAWRNIAA
jgi:hypothetical protein